MKLPDRQDSPSFMHPSRRHIALATLALTLASASGTAHADATCKYIDAEGRVTFANVPIRNARRVLCFDPVPDRTPAPKQRADAPPRRASPDASGNVKVDPETQRRRDLDRRGILERELAEERSLLEEANRSVSAGRNDTSAQGQSRQRALEEAVARHSRNVEAIQRELVSVR
jgi:hypothetical protein